MACSPFRLPASRSICFPFPTGISLTFKKSTRPKKFTSIELFCVFFPPLKQEFQIIPLKFCKKKSRKLFQVYSQQNRDQFFLMEMLLLIRSQRILFFDSNWNSSSLLFVEWKFGKFFSNSISFYVESPRITEKSFQKQKWRLFGNMLLLFSIIDKKNQSLQLKLIKFYWK